MDHNSSALRRRDIVVGTDCDDTAEERAPSRAMPMKLSSCARGAEGSPDLATNTAKCGRRVDAGMKLWARQHTGGGTHGDDGENNNGGGGGGMRESAGQRTNITRAYLARSFLWINN